MKPREPTSGTVPHHRNPLDPLGRATAQRVVPTAAPQAQQQQQQQQQQSPPGEELKWTGLAAFIKQYQHVIFLATVVVVLLCIFLLMRLATRSFFRKLWGIVEMLRQKLGPGPQVVAEKKFV